MTGVSNKEHLQPPDTSSTKQETTFHLCDLHLMFNHITNDTKPTWRIQNRCPSYTKTW